MKTPKHLATVMAITMVAGSVAPVMAATTSSETIIGNDRHETAVKISKEGWKSAETVILVNSSAIPDALTATPLAHAKKAPILLTGKDGLNKATANEIKRLGAKNVIMIGGDAVLSAKVEKDLKALNVKVDRIKGATREETALAIAKRLDGIKDVSEIAVVNGTTGLADAVSVAAAAAEKGMPILLANPKKGLSAAEKFIKDEAIKASFVIGGKTALPEKLVSNLPGKQRIEGLDRKDTNAKVIEKFYTGKELNNVYLAKDGMGDSEQLIDALAVGALAAKNGAPVLIASKKLSEKQIDVINTKKIETITQVGGKGNEGAFNQLKDIEETDVYEVGTVEELEEALANANANDKIVLKPNATITEDIIISTDKNVDIKVEGTVTGKVEITAPNGNVVDNSTSKPSGGGSSSGTPSTPSVDQNKVKLVDTARAAKDYKYLGNPDKNENPYNYTGEITVSGNESANVNFEGPYKAINLSSSEKKASMNDMSRYLGALHRTKNSNIEAIEYNGKTYKWSKVLSLKGSNWVLNVDSNETNTPNKNTLISNIVADAKGEGPINLVLVDANGNKANLTINFKSTLPAKVNDVYYDSLAKAVEMVIKTENKTGTVILTKDSSGGGIGLFNPKDSELKANLTIDLGGHTYTMTSPSVGSIGTESQAFHLERSNTVTIKNGDIVVDSSGVTTNMLIQNYCNLTLEDLNLVGGDSTEFILSCNNGNTSLKNVNISGSYTKGDLVGIDAMHWPNNTYPVAPVVTVNNTNSNKIDGRIDSYCSAGEQNDYHKDGVAKSKIILNGGKYTGKLNGVSSYKHLGNIEITSGIFNQNVSDYCVNDHTCNQSGSNWIVK